MISFRMRYRPVTDPLLLQRTVTHRRPPLPNRPIPLHNRPLALRTVPHRPLPLLTVTHRSRPLLNVTGKVFFNE